MELFKKERLGRDEHYTVVAAKNKPFLLRAESRLTPEAAVDETLRKRELFEATEQDLFSQDLGGASFADLLQDPDEPRTQRAIEEYVASLVTAYTSAREAESTAFVEQGFGLVLVRPEVLHATENIYAFLDTNDIDIIDTHDVQLTPEQYVALYSHAFIDKQKRPHVRRRALGYVHHDLEAVIIRHRDPRLHSNAFMQFVVDELKGVAGRQDTTTLRGSVVYKALADICQPENTSARLALDPLQLYDIADAANDYGDGVNRYLANLPGIHIPDSSEVTKDFCVIAGSSTLAEFITGANTTMRDAS